MFYFLINYFMSGFIKFLSLGSFQSAINKHFSVISIPFQFGATISCDVGLKGNWRKH